MMSEKLRGGGVMSGGQEHQPWGLRHGEVAKDGNAVMHKSRGQGNVMCRV